MSHRHRPYYRPRRTRSAERYRAFLDAVLVVASILVLIVWATRVH